MNSLKRGGKTNMPKSDLEKSIEQAANSFALQVLGAVKNSTLQELLELQKQGEKKKPGRKPGIKTEKKKPGPKPKAVKKAAAKPVKKKRVVKNYPKCAYPRCRSNRFVRGKGYCGKHWKMWLAGEIKGAKTFKKK
ncbi:MAG: hypothetical protein GY847_16335 [Proteobacteria bacterium]|nr:hypothetical protein [Pseudomonadota bacterium]